ncbi:MAG: hypothetical protein LUC93_04640 [Planctomycetaceae bacterium]|nr:hypothetical protein [Planctomycetaceae bacterium]
MSSAMSTKRSFVSVRSEVDTKTSYLPLIALISGALFLAFGIKLDSTALSIVGFVAFTASMLYYNSMFWARALKNHKLDSARVSQIRKYY